MVMKMHSYIAVNGYLQQVTTQSQCLISKLRQMTTEEGGWEEAISVAKARREELDNATASQDDFTPSATPGEVLPDGTTRSYVNPATATALRKRLLAVSPRMDRRIGTPTVEQAEPTSSTPPSTSGDNIGPAVRHPLVDHPNEDIAALAKEYSELQAELTSPGPHYVKWPNNITLKNFALYQLIPTLVYELEYPRTDRCVLASLNLRRKLDGDLESDLYICSRKRSRHLGRSLYSILLLRAL
jgi:sterol O-acyltransferase